MSTIAKPILPPPCALYFRVPGCNCIVDAEIDGSASVGLLHAVYDDDGSRGRVSEVRLDAIREALAHGKAEYLPSSEWQAVSAGARFPL